ncbi:hypothetical protein NEUTE2DRAFT_169259 [Neurospora tetrasperma FGSC 2509]|nr:hypothetical protein NEUTE2DRAFT_169259 [Neurospora tetrasperma FGSC 2509]
MTPLNFNTPISPTAVTTSTNAQANANFNASTSTITHTNTHKDGSGNRAPLPPLLSGALALVSRDLVFFVKKAELEEILRQRRMLATCGDSAAKAQVNHLEVTIDAMQALRIEDPLTALGSGVIRARRL